MKKVIKAVLLAIREDTYTQYVFRDLDTSKYIMCTRLPNWQVPEIFVGNEGFLEYDIVQAGDTYMTPQGITSRYNYSNIYFNNFVVLNNVTQQKEIIL